MRSGRGAATDALARKKGTRWRPATQGFVRAVTAAAAAAAVLSMVPVVMVVTALHLASWGGYVSSFVSVVTGDRYAQNSDILRQRDEMPGALTKSCWRGTGGGGRPRHNPSSGVALPSWLSA